MAAYNSGPGTVQAAVKRTGYADFWELYQRNVLPKETRNYVPIILAMTIVSKNLSQYGFDDVSMDEPIAYDEVSIDYPVNLRLVADCVGSTPEQLQDLNPSLLRLSTPRQGKFELHLPAGTKEEYETEIASIPPDMRLWWRYHKVEPGDTLASIAHSYRVTAKSIETANHLDGAELEQDAHLIIPVAPSKYAADSATYARRITRYHVRSGDTVESVAENFGISPKMLRRWNGLHSESLRGRKAWPCTFRYRQAAKAVQPHRADRTCIRGRPRKWPAPLFLVRKRRPQIPRDLPRKIAPRALTFCVTKSSPAKHFIRSQPPTGPP